MLDNYGTDFLEWDPASVSISLSADFGIERPSQKVLDKINAFMTLLTTDQFFKTMEGFTSIAFPLNRKPMTMAPFEILSPRELSWAVAEASLMLSDDLKPEMFSPEVARFVGVVLSEAGFLKAPEMLKFAIFPPKEDDEAPLNVAVEADMKRNANEIQEVSSFIRSELVQFFQQIEKAPLLNRNREWGSIHQSLLSKLKLNP